jgi:hypothetical protein
MNKQIRLITRDLKEIVFHYAEVRAMTRITLWNVLENNNLPLSKEEIFNLTRLPDKERKYVYAHIKHECLPSYYVNDVPILKKVKEGYIVNPEVLRNPDSPLNKVLKLIKENKIKYW